jgi:uncharacterized NAD(P)/FAD-binding protein YdhS
MRLAIIGIGPKGMFALERLLDHAQRADPPARLDIDLFEPHAFPGAGPVYDPQQPEYLRMNFAAEHVNMWGPESRAVPARERLHFSDWWRDVSGDMNGPQRYPPRAHVGRYLADGLSRMLRHAPEGTDVTLRLSAVRTIERTGARWRIVAGDGWTGDYDEVLMTVGHPSSSVFPVDRHLSRERVAPGATVAIRGFALTFIDAALALTEGRGGVFDAEDHAYRLRYLPGGQEAGLILPFSRSGRPILAKPDPDLAAGIAALEVISQAGSERVLALADPVDLHHDLLAILASTAAASWVAANPVGPAATGQARARRAADDWLESACTGTSPPAGHGPAAELERSLAVGTGLHPPDLQWALGHTWRSLYPALVSRLGAAGLPDEAWPAFRRLAAQMERVAFGPPPVNAAKLLALVHARRVDLSHVTAAALVTADHVTSIRSEHGEHEVDVVVNAVLPAPGAHADDLSGQLIDNGWGRIRRGRRGLDVTADASCIGRDGRRTPGLATMGRATEDAVIGNDTLSRSLHPHADRWACRVVSRSVRPSVAAPISAG